MAIKINPFHELYVGESIGPEKFVKLFSPSIVEHSLTLFQPGHVILKGLPGTGKSMLLNLLKPSIRLAYSKLGVEFPVPVEFRKFIGAGINLKRSGISDFGQRKIDADEDQNLSAIYFGDFLNYWIVSDILASIQKLCTDDTGNTLANEIGLRYEAKLLDEFAMKMASLDCWSDYLTEVVDFNKLKEQLNRRISAYRSFLNYNLEEIPRSIKESKTLIGVPISKCIETLKQLEIVNNDVEFFIRIDQFEELAWLETSATDPGKTYQEMILKLLGMRDPNVSYRIGTRHFAWAKVDKKMFGSAAKLESKRNFKEVSIDSVLRRKENVRTWIFPEFAEDIFNRRIVMSSYLYDANDGSLLTYVFGKGLSPEERAKKYVPNEKERALRLEDNWGKEFNDFLLELSAENPLSARLGEAWARQKGKEKIIEDIELAKTYPWEEKKWWKKERVEQALLQIASRNQQQLIWYGKDDILGLSGGNILTFLSLCQHIWDVFIRDRRNVEESVDLSLPKIDYVIQSVGIKEASDDWFNDISNEKGGKERKLFISYIGRYFNKTLSDDKAMSYPGRNGFSLTLQEFEQSQIIKEFLNDSTDYGDLQGIPHTTKSNDKKQRRKWYLNPILSPHFKIPYSHTKEPLYIKLEELKMWLIDSETFNEQDVGFVIDELKKKRKSSKNNTGQQGSIQFP